MKHTIKNIIAREILDSRGKSHSGSRRNTKEMEQWAVQLCRQEPQLAAMKRLSCVMEMWKGIQEKAYWKAVFERERYH